MRNRIRSITILCVATALLAGCPGTTQTPAASTETSVAKTDEPSTAPEPAQGKRAAGQENEPVMAWRAFGTEPFWGARVDGDTLVFTTPEDQAGKTMSGRRVPSLVGFVYVGKDGDTDFNLDIRPGECSDGMSDYHYEYVSTFIYGKTTYKGCAEAAK